VSAYAITVAVVGGEVVTVAEAMMLSNKMGDWGWERQIIWINAGGINSIRNVYPPATEKKSPKFQRDCWRGIHL
jgi:hypothetical protein